MKILETKQGAVAVMKPAGPLTQADATEFRTLALRSIESNLGRCVVDMSAIPFVDSMGLEALMDITEAVTQSGHMLKLCSTNKVVREVFSLTGIDLAFEYFDDLTTAVRSFL